MKNMNTIATAGMMALIMTVSLSSITFAREAESGSGSSGRSSAHVELGDDHGGMRVSGASDDSMEIHRSAGHLGTIDDHGGLRVSGSSDDSLEAHRSAGHLELEDDRGGNRGPANEVRLFDDNDNNRRGAQLNGNAVEASELRKQIADLIQKVEQLLAELMQKVVA